MSLVEAALLDQTRRVLEMNPKSLKLDTERQSWSHRAVPTSWCKVCGKGIGRTKPNESGYCSRKPCRTIHYAGRGRHGKRAA